MMGNAKKQIEQIHRDAKKQIQDLQKRLLKEYFLQITEAEQLLFNKIFPHGVSKAKMNQALELLERTIDKNNTQIVNKLLTEEIK